MLGHVERTNDRDYEIEERYAFPAAALHCRILIHADDTGQWRPRPIGYRKRQKGIWTRCVVRYYLHRDEAVASEPC